MSFGIKVTNIYDETQIDGLRKNFQVVNNGIANPVVPAPSGFGYLCPVYADSSRSQIVMARNVATLAGNDIGASSYYYPNNTLNISSYAAIKFVVLEPIASVPVIPGPNFGLEVYDPSGLIVFSSAVKNFIIDAAITVVSPGYYTYQDVTLPAVEFGQRYYQMLLRWGYQTEMEGYGITYQELSPTQIRIWIQGTPGFTFSFLTGYFNG